MQFLDVVELVSINLSPIIAPSLSCPALPSPPALSYPGTSDLPHSLPRPRLLLRPLAPLSSFPFGLQTPPSSHRLGPITLCAENTCCCQPTITFLSCITTEEGRLLPDTS